MGCVEAIYLERTRLLGLTTLLAVLFLLCLFLVAEAGRSRMHDAAEAMQKTMARQLLLGDLREDIAESDLAYRSYLLTGNSDLLQRLREVGTRVNAKADTLVASYRGEPRPVMTAANQVRYLAGVETGIMTTTLQVYGSQGAEAALRVAKSQHKRSDPMLNLLGVADELKRYEAARLREARVNWLRETSLARQLAIMGTIANILLVVSVMLMAYSTYRRHRESTQQVARRRDELEVEARARASELNEVYGRLQTVEEQERSRLARGLHDELGGLLLAARMDVSWLLRHSTDASIEARLGRLRRVQDALDEGIDLKRRVIEELRPTLLDNMGLVAALRWQLGEACGRAGLECSGHFPDDEPAVEPDTAIALFRVLQEALTNVLKHAGARHVEVTLDATESHLRLIVADDGRGVAPADLARPQTHGLAGMKHRIAAVGGTLQVSRSARGGTEVTALAPRFARSASAA